MKGLVQRTDFAGSAWKWKRSANALPPIAVHPVALVRAAFRFRLKFPVELKNGSIGQTLTMTRQHRSQDRQNPRLPINQGAVAVKADSGET